jgi:dihydropteroate synthase
MGRWSVVHDVLAAARKERGAAIMAVCNVTPDSFSDGGEYFAVDAAVARVQKLFSEGAEIVDLGAESTRPGATPVPADEQLRRLLPVVRATAELGCLSIDTTEAEVARQTLRLGARILNDVSCLRNEALAQIARDEESVLVVMHARGLPSEMQNPSQYPEAAYLDVVSEVVREWNAARKRACDQGVSEAALWMDPGLGFAKSAQHSWALLAHTRDLVASVGVPVLVGASRKSFLKVTDATALPRERVGASIAAALYAARSGAAIVRVHDVRETRQALVADRQIELQIARSEVPGEAHPSSTGGQA